jgi:hypothetical protein
MIPNASIQGSIRITVVLTTTAAHRRAWTEDGNAGDGGRRARTKDGNADDGGWRERRREESP